MMAASGQLYRSLSSFFFLTRANLHVAWVALVYTKPVVKRVPWHVRSVCGSLGKSLVFRAAKSGPLDALRAEKSHITY